MGDGGVVAAKGQMFAKTSGHARVMTPDPEIIAAITAAFEALNETPPESILEIIAAIQRIARKGQSTYQAAYILAIGVCSATLLCEISSASKSGPWGDHRPNLDLLKYWSGRQDSNLRPLAPHASALPGCATPRPDVNDSPIGRQRL
jgi:hypothetical protein